MVNIGIIGAGRMGKAHADAFKEIPEARLSGVYDAAAEPAKAFAAAYGMKKVYAASAELAGDKNLDAVMVCCPTFIHYQVMAELVGSGKAIFCEKPLVRHTEEGDRLLALAAAAKARIMVGYNRRYNPASAKLRELIAAGGLGAVRMAKVGCCVSGYKRQRGDWFADFDLCGGVTLDMMSHHLDLLNWYFGEAERAYGENLRFDKAMSEPMDFVSATVTYKNGVICNIEGAWQRYGQSYDKIEIYGDKATALLSGNQLQVFGYGRSEIFSWDDSPSPYQRQARAFVNLAVSGAAPLADIHDGYNAIRVANAINMSALERRVVVLSGKQEE